MLYIIMSYRKGHCHVMLLEYIQSDNDMDNMIMKMANDMAPFQAKPGCLFHSIMELRASASQHWVIRNDSFRSASVACPPSGLISRCRPDQTGRLFCRSVCRIPKLFF